MAISSGAADNAAGELSTPLKSEFHTHPSSGSYTRSLMVSTATIILVAVVLVRLLVRYGGGTSDIMMLKASLDVERGWFFAAFPVPAEVEKQLYTSIGLILKADLESSPGNFQFYHGSILHTTMIPPGHAPTTGIEVKEQVVMQLERMGWRTVERAEDAKSLDLRCGNVKRTLRSLWVTIRGIPEGICRTGNEPHITLAKPRNGTTDDATVRVVVQSFEEAMKGQHLEGIRWEQNYVVILRSRTVGVDRNYEEVDRVYLGGLQ